MENGVHSMSISKKDVGHLTSNWIGQVTDGERTGSFIWKIDQNGNLFSCIFLTSYLEDNTSSRRRRQKHESFFRQKTRGQFSLFGISFFLPILNGLDPFNFTVQFCLFSRLLLLLAIDFLSKFWLLRTGSFDRVCLAGVSQFSEACRRLA